jgi:glycosyltransferase involved in cell wall biosynthesis
VPTDDRRIDGTFLGRPAGPAKGCEAATEGLRSKVRIGINLLYLLPGEVGGVETYARGLLNALTDLDELNEYVIFVATSASAFSIPLVHNMRRVTVPINAHNRWMRYLWEQVCLPVQAWRYRLDLLHSLNYVGPLLCPCSSIVTIHDVNHKAVPQSIALLRRLALAAFSGASAHLSTRVVTVSDFSASEITRLLHVTGTRITVIHSGLGSAEHGPGGLPADVTGRYGITLPYIAAFAGTYEHKNISTLITAFSTGFAARPYQLVLIGQLAPSARSAISGLSPGLLGKVSVLGHVPTADIGPLLAHASLFVLPSLYEGFGFPLLEAQTAGTVVACSNAAALPEIGGAGAVYFDPKSIPEMIAAMSTGLDDESARAACVLAAKQNIRRFSWKKAAASYLDLYRLVVAQADRSPTIAGQAEKQDHRHTPESSVRP